MTHVDVIIIGAGPGGLQCARELAHSQQSVLLLDRKKQIGPKVCAGGISGLDIDLLKIPKEELGQAYSSIDLVTRSRRAKFSIGKDYLFTIGREELGQWQLKQIDAPNIEIRTNCRVVKVNEKSVLLDSGEEVGFNYLVGADGATSIVRRFLNLPPGQGFATYQYVVPQVFPKLEFHFDDAYFHAGYAWIFPHKDSTLIGCGADPKLFSPKKLKEGFMNWAKDYDIDLSQAQYQSFPIRVEYKGWNFGNIFLIGEAAGLVSPLTAEGIYMALASGSELAKLIKDKNHPQAGMEELLAKWKRHKTVADIIIKSNRHRKKLFNFLIWLSEKKIVQKKLIKRYIPKSFAQA